MIVYVYPADAYGCGHYRLIWPGLALRNQGYDVRVISPTSRDSIKGEYDRDPNTDPTARLLNFKIPDDADVIVLQRVTHQLIAQGLAWLREQRRPVGVVVDMDDDLRSIHPSNPAFVAMHKKMGYKIHSADNAMSACLHATVVTVSTKALLPIYAPHGRGVVLHNRVPAGYLDIPHVDSPAIGWAGSVHSHPDDLHEVGPAVARLLREGHTYRGAGPPEGLQRALMLDEEPEVTGSLDLDKWPYGVSEIGVGIAPLADTGFNAAKSWLKPLEMSAVGVPWVASPRTEYLRLHKETGAGVLAKNRGDWYRELRRMCTDEAHRRELSEAGRAAAAANTVEAHAWRWMEVWERAAAEAKRAAPAFGRVLGG